MKRPNPYNIPSQYPVRRNDPTALGPGADLFRTDELKRKRAFALDPGQGEVGIEDVYSENGVLSIYDSRPINSSDFLLTTPVIDVLSPGNRSIVFNTVVPNGRILVLRNWEISSILQTAGAPITNPNGTSNVRARIRFLIDGSDVPNYSFLLFNTLPFGTAGADSFIMAPDNSTFSFVVDIVDPTSPDITFADGQIVLYGNLLPSTGRNLNLEQGTKDPIPVKVK